MYFSTNKSRLQVGFWLLCVTLVLTYNRKLDRFVMSEAEPFGTEYASCAHFANMLEADCSMHC